MSEEPTLADMSGGMYWYKLSGEYQRKILKLKAFIAKQSKNIEFLKKEIKKECLVCGSSAR